MYEFVVTPTGFSLRLGTVPTLILLVVWVFSVVVTWRIYIKAYVPGWNCLIPILNSYRMYQIAGMKPWFAFLVFIPVIGWVAAFVLSLVARVKMIKAFGGSDLLAILSIFFSLFILPIIAFSSKYDYEG